VLLTRAPLARRPKARRASDLHVLSLPLAFVLSQDQTLQLFLSGCSSKLLSHFSISISQSILNLE
jgi:hypothetical protein